MRIRFALKLQKMFCGLYFPSARRRGFERTLPLKLWHTVDTKPAGEDDVTRPKPSGDTR